MVKITETEKTQIIQRDQELAERQSLIETIAGLTRPTLEEFHSAHFSELSPSVQEGLQKLEEAVWAISKTLKQTWPRLKEYMK